MSLKENVNFVKEELNSEEKFLENFVRVERFFKKYKKVIIASISIAVVLVLGYGVNNYISETNKKEANIAFNKILKNPNDNAAFETLKSKNEKLAQIVLFLNNKSNTTKIDIDYLKELDAYQKASMQNDLNKISEITMKNDFLLKEYALFNKALLQAKQKDFNAAKETLKIIPKDSKTRELVMLLEHYLITKK